MSELDYSVALFYSTSGAIRAEKLAKESGLRVKLIPVPRHLSSDCGLCLRFQTADLAAIRSMLEGAAVEWEDIRSL